MVCSFFSFKTTNADLSVGVSIDDRISTELHIFWVPGRRRGNRKCIRTSSSLLPVLWAYNWQLTTVDAWSVWPPFTDPFGKRIRAREINDSRLTTSPVHLGICARLPLFPYRSRQE